jgi:hypothetical protein
MTTPSTITIQTDLLRITTIKRKHATQIRENINARPQTKFQEVELLAHIDEWDGILCRRIDNGHFVILPVANYYRQTTSSLNYSHAQAQAQERIHNLPQLFLD